MCAECVESSESRSTGQPTLAPPERRGSRIGCRPPCRSPISPPRPSRLSPPRCRQAASAVKGKSTWHEPSPMPSGRRSCGCAGRHRHRQVARLSRPGGAVRPTDGHRHRHQSAQDQLAGKDLPFLADHLDVPFRFAVLKDDRIISVSSGSTNSRPTTDSISTSTTPNETAVRSTARRSTSCGLRHHIRHRRSQRARDDRRPHLAPRLRRARRMPRGEPLPAGDDCLAEKARHKAAEADILVVNLHLYAGDHRRCGASRTRPRHDRRSPPTRGHRRRSCRPTDQPGPGPGRCPQHRIRARRHGASQRAEESATSLHVALEPLIGERLLDGPDAEVGKALDDVRAATERLLDALRAVPDSAPADTRTKALAPGKSPPA